MTEEEYQKSLARIVMLFSGDIVDIVRSRMETIIRDEQDL
jgi:hypothetical protein